MTVVDHFQRFSVIFLACVQVWRRTLSSIGFAPKPFVEDSNEASIWVVCRRQPWGFHMLYPAFTTIATCIVYLLASWPTQPSLPTLDASTAPHTSFLVSTTKQATMMDVADLEYLRSIQTGRARDLERPARDKSVV
jgi:hypothetical protein